MISEYNQKLIKLAEELGWKVNTSKINHSGLHFEKGNFYIWKSTHSGLHWRRCEYINERPANHKSYTTCEEALKDECVEDISKGLSKHNLKVGQMCKYYSDNRKNLETLEFEPIYSNCKVLSAFGENCQFVLIETEDGKQFGIPVYELKVD